MNSATLLFSFDSTTTLFLSIITLIKYSPLLSNVYLNDVEEGGETEFLYQGVKLKPETGKLVIFPTSYMYPHRGNPIYKGEKYIITGWYTYDK